jgi:hypothetical protein
MQRHARSLALHGMSIGELGIVAGSRVRRRTPGVHPLRQVRRIDVQSLRQVQPVAQQMFLSSPPSSYHLMEETYDLEPPQGANDAPCLGIRRNTEFCTVLHSYVEPRKTKIFCIQSLFSLTYHEVLLLNPFELDKRFSMFGWVVQRFAALPSRTTVQTIRCQREFLRELKRRRLRSQWGDTKTCAPHGGKHDWM